MKINEKYKIESIDLMNVTLFEKYIGKKGKNKDKELWKPISYHPNFESAFKYLVDREILSTGLESFEAIEKKIIELKEFKSRTFKEENS